MSGRILQLLSAYANRIEHPGIKHICITPLRVVDVRIDFTFICGISLAGLDIQAIAKDVERYVRDQTDEPFSHVSYDFSMDGCIDCVETGRFHGLTDARILWCALTLDVPPLMDAWRIDGVSLNEMLGA